MIPGIDSKESISPAYVRWTYSYSVASHAIEYFKIPALYFSTFGCNTGGGGGGGIGQRKK
jgi:hypothetical protein